MIIYPACVRIGDRSLEVVTGGAGSPSVIFEAGQNEDLRTWRQLPGRVACLSTVVAYDRLGNGRSSPANGNRSALDCVFDLRQLLHALKVKPPFVIVGHSLGGTFATVFASVFHHETTGLVLVDPTPYDWRESLLPMLSSQLQHLASEYDSKSPEGKGWAETARQARNAQVDPSIWVTVISAGHPLPGGREVPEYTRALQTKHQILAYGSAHGRHLVANDAPHHIHHQSPDLIFREISSMIYGIRSQSRNT